MFGVRSFFLLGFRMDLKSLLPRFFFVSFYYPSFAIAYFIHSRIFTSYSNDGNAIYNVSDGTRSISFHVHDLWTNMMRVRSITPLITPVGHTLAEESSKMLIRGKGHRFGCEPGSGGVVTRRWSDKGG